MTSKEDQTSQKTPQGSMPARATGSASIFGQQASGNGANYTSSSSNNSSSDSSYLAAANTPAYKMSAPISLNRNKSYDLDGPVDERSALAQILSGISDMQREVSQTRCSVASCHLMFHFFSLADDPLAH